MDNLPVKIRRVHHVEVNNSYRTHAGRSKIEKRRGAKTTRSHAKHLGGLELFLPSQAYFGHNQMPRVTQRFFPAERTLGLIGVVEHQRIRLNSNHWFVFSRNNNNNFFAAKG